VLITTGFPTARGIKEQNRGWLAVILNAKCTEIKGLLLFSSIHIMEAICVERIDSEKDEPLMW
jgi:hypothetical protein